MKITISTSKTTSSIKLGDIEEIKWENDYNLSRFILINLDNLLKKRSLQLSDIENFEFENQENTGFTTSRIAETTVNILNFARISPPLADQTRPL